MAVRKGMGLRGGTVACACGRIIFYCSHPPKFTMMADDGAKRRALSVLRVNYARR